MKRLILSLLIATMLMTPTHKAHALDAKGKAFLIICTYGTVGGALLGFASMAFGTNSRAIAQGASLGLYAGIAFGAYVVSSHRKGSVVEEPVPAYPNQPPPPSTFGTPPLGQDNGGFGAPPPEENSGGFFGGQRALEINEDLMYNYRLENKKGRDITLPVYINLYNATF